MSIFNLKKIVQEILTENDPIVYGTDSASKMAAKNKLKQTPDFNKMKSQDKTALFTGIDQDKDGGVLNLEEEEIDEMAAPSVKYEINDISKIDNLKLGTKAIERVKKLATYVDSYGPVSKSEMAAKAFDAPLRQQQINDLVDILNSVGIFKVASGSEERAKQYAQNYAWSRLEKEKPEEKPAEKISTKVSAKDIEASLVSFPKGDGEEEPEIKAAPSAATTVSPARRAAIEFFYDEKNERLLKKIINTYSASRAKIKEIKEEVGDIDTGDFKKGEISRKEKALSELDQLIQDMADRIKAVGDPEIIDEILKELSFGLNSIGYAKLYGRIEKVVKSEQIDEWTKGKLQYYAGIKP